MAEQATHAKTLPARFGSASRKSRWRTAPAAKQAADWWKDFLLRCSLAPTQDRLGDAAHIQINGTRIAITTDSFVVKPLSFPGGSIGELAMNGTVNDLGRFRRKGGSAWLSPLCWKPACRLRFLRLKCAPWGRPRASRRGDRRRRHQSRRARQSRPHVHQHHRHWTR